MSVREESIPKGVRRHAPEPPPSRDYTNPMALPWRVTTETLNRSTPEHLVVNKREELVATFEDRSEAEYCVQRVNGEQT